MRLIDIIIKDVDVIRGGKMLEFARTLIKRLGKRLINMFNMKNFNWNSLGHSIVTETVLTLVVCLVTVAVMKTVGA